MRIKFIIFAVVVGSLVVIFVSRVRPSIPTATPAFSEDQENRKLFDLEAQGQLVPRSLPVLKTEGNKIIRSDTNREVKLRGVISDYFRGIAWRHYYSPPKEDNVSYVIQRIQKIKKEVGINFLVLYLSNPSYLEEKQAELDQIIEYAYKNGMYVSLFPVARDFFQTKAMVSINRPKTSGDPQDLNIFLDTLSSRYSNYPHILYGTGAEPDRFIENDTYWDTVQKELIITVRKNSPHALVIINHHQNYSPIKDIEDTFQEENLIYNGGGYAGKDRANEDYTGGNINWHYEIFEKQTSGKMPTIFTEFGGFWGGDFGHEDDLAHTKKYLEALNRLQGNYTAYRLDPSGTGLDLFDTEGNFTPKGQLFVNALYENPPTYIK